jgi:transposase-like protein
MGCQWMERLLRLRELGLAHLHVTGGRLNNRAEVSHQPTRRRERRMGRHLNLVTSVLEYQPH